LAVGRRPVFGSRDRRLQPTTRRSSGRATVIDG
jgi:hypothetical protein